MAQQNINFTAKLSGDKSVYDQIRRMSEAIKDDIIKDTLQIIEKGGRAAETFERKIKSGIKGREGERFGAEFNIRKGYEERIERTKEAYQQKIDQSPGRQKIFELKRDAEIQRIEKERDAELKKEKEYGSVEAKLLQELIEVIKENARKELDQDLESVQRKIKDYESGKFIPKNSEDKLKTELQKEALNKDEDDGIQKVEVQENFVKNFLRGFQEEFGRRLTQTLLSIPNMLATGQTAEYNEAEFLRLVPLIGDALAIAQGRHLRERDQRMGAAYGMGGTTGKTGQFSGARYGFDSGQMTEFGVQLAKTRGSATNLRGDIEDIVAMSKALNIDIGSLIQQSVLDSMQGGGTALSRMRGLTGAMGITEGGDRSSLMRLMEIQTRLIQRQSQIQEGLEPGAVNSAMGMFKRVGGSFGDVMRMEERMGQVQQGLTSPQNPFQSASQFAILSSLNKGGSFYQLKEMEEKGMYTPDFLQKTMEHYQKVYGGGELGMEAVRRRFNLSHSQGRELFESFNQNPNLFKGMGDGETSIKDLFTRGDMKRLGSGFTTQTDRQTAQINDAFSESMIKGFKTQLELLGDQLQKDIGGFMKMSVSIMSNGETWEKAGNSLAKGFLNSVAPGSGEVMLNNGRRE